MAGIYLAEVVLPAADGVPADSVVNTLTFTSADTITPSNVGIITIPLANLFTVATPTSGFKLGGYISEVIARTTNGCSMKVYDITTHLDGSPHGSPVAIDTFTMPAVLNTDTLPEECACVVTLRGEGWDTAAIESPDADTPPDGKVDRLRQRRSGRVFLGPLIKQTCAVDGTVHHAIVQQAFRTTILEAFEASVAQWVGDDVALGVWSRKAASVHDVVRIEVDNAFDTQRRRGPRATVRDSHNF